MAPPVGASLRTLQPQVKANRTSLVFNIGQTLFGVVVGTAQFPAITEILLRERI